MYNSNYQRVIIGGHMKEIWKDISEYEGLYQVSNLGRVKSLGRYINKTQWLPEKIKATGDNGNGYKIVNLYKNNKGKMFYVHRLVAKAFLGDIPLGYEVNHIDFDKSNNKLCNLEIVSRLDNVKHNVVNGRLDSIRGKQIIITFKDG
jgi:hypothetical protein